MAGGHPANHARPAGVVPAHRDRGTAAPRRGSSSITELLRRAAASAENIGARTLIVCGGVACNSGLRAAARDARLPYPALFPSPGLSTDNAAMIAAAAFPRLARGEFDDLTLPARANLALA